MAFAFNPSPVQSFANPAFNVDAGAAAPPPPVMPAPAPAPVAVAPPEPASAPAKPYQPSFWDVLQGVVFDQKSPAEAAMGARQLHYQAQQQQLLMQALQNATPEQRQAMLFNGAEYGKAVAGNFAPQIMKMGQTAAFFGPGGPRYTAPVMGFDPVSGKFYTQTPEAATQTGASLGGDFKLNSTTGALISGRTGLTGQAVAVPQILAPGSVPNTFTQPGSSGPPGAPQPGAPQAGAGQGGAVPRGIRNNNLGNLRAPPGSLPGQVGVDAGGYAVFASPIEGAAAAKANLAGYAKQGINTVAGVVSRWAPQGDGNNPGNYANFVAATMGVKPDQKIDLSDPDVQQKMLKGIFVFENGPKAMSAWKYQQQAGGSAPPAANGNVGAPAPGWSGPAAKTPAPMSAADRKRWNIPASDPNQYAIGPDGKPFVSSSAPYTADNLLKQRSDFYNSPDYQLHLKTVNGINSLQLAMSKASRNNGIVDMAAFDNLIQAQTGLSARQGNVGMLMAHIGLPQEVLGRLGNIAGEPVTPQTLKQALSVLRAYGTTHQATAQHHLDEESAVAKRYGYDFGVTLPSINPAPNVKWMGGNADGSPSLASGGGVALPSSIPPIEKRPVGFTTNSPKGLAKWNGTSWDLVPKSGQK